MFKSLLPQGAPFFELLLSQNEKLCASAEALNSILENPGQMEKTHRDVSDLEAEADKIHARITRYLSRTFITPIDREDILRITKMQEEVIDQLFNMTNRLYIFEFPRMPFPMLRLGQTLSKMCKFTRSMLTGLSKNTDTHETKAFRALRNEGEMLLSMALVELHDLSAPTPENILAILKWTQIYDRLESTMNFVVSLSETIDEAVLKNV
ncbi:MAG: DUF47 domain-containing protein [Desulfovibrio sp.]|jgi:uncharacterized protein Yka (UPF0111/DUF47 family)|nr:DUF47 domain-containing protein [Desulfovibrio sp.]